MHDAGDRNHRIVVTLRHGEVLGPEDFRADTTAVPTPGPGQFLSRTIYLSLDPSYGRVVHGGALPSERLNPGDVMAGETVAQVLESRHPDHRPGEYIVVRNGWQQFALSSGQGVRKLDPGNAPISTALGVLGAPGLTGYVGLVYLGEPKPGQTVVVTAATGPVGCTAGQSARLIGARAVGIADSEDKCEYALRELGYAACINYRSGDLASHLRRVCPDGVHVSVDSVGGHVLTTVVSQLALHARVVLCGATEGYDSDPVPPGSFLGPLVAARATVRGLVVDDHLHRLPELVNVVGGWIRSGQFHYRQEITEGLASAPEAFCRLLQGESFGRALVRVAPEHL